MESCCKDQNLSAKIRYQSTAHLTVSNNNLPFTLHFTYEVWRGYVLCQLLIICRDCEMYPHVYTCTCLDTTLHATLYKHIHLIHMETSENLIQVTTQLCGLGFELSEVLPFLVSCSQPPSLSGRVWSTVISFRLSISGVER